MKNILLTLLLIGPTYTFAATSESSICGKVVEITSNSWSSENQSLVRVRKVDGTFTGACIEHGILYDYAIASLRDTSLNVCFSKNELGNIDAATLSN